MGLTREQVKAIALAHGFTARNHEQADGTAIVDLNRCVYEFAAAIFQAGAAAGLKRAQDICESNIDEDERGPEFRWNIHSELIAAIDPATV